jgi:hypothetical protein
MIHAGPASGTRNSTLKKQSSRPCAATSRLARSSSSRSRSGGRADGYSKRSNEFVSGYLTESVTPTVVTVP